MRPSRGLALLAAVAALAVGSQARDLLAEPTNADLETLNFALQIKCLQAEFYTYAGSGRQLTAGESMAADEASISGDRENLPLRNLAGDAKVRSLCSIMSARTSH